MLRTTKRTARALQLNLDGGVDDVTPRKKRDNEELKHQTLLFDRRLQLMDIYPDLRWMFGSQGGIYIPPAMLRQAWGAGLVRGVLDVWLIVPRTDVSTSSTGSAKSTVHYCGLAMDLKKLKGGRPSKEQLEWAAHLAASGWKVFFPSGVMDAWRCLACYLGIAGNDHTARDLEQQEEYIRLLARPS